MDSKDEYFDFFQPQQYVMRNRNISFLKHVNLLPILYDMT